VPAALLLSLGAPNGFTASLSDTPTFRLLDGHLLPLRVPRKGTAQLRYQDGKRIADIAVDEIGAWVFVRLRWAGWL